MSSETWDKTFIIVLKVLKRLDFVSRVSSSAGKREEHQIFRRKLEICLELCVFQVSSTLRKILSVVTVCWQLHF